MNDRWQVVVAAAIVLAVPLGGCRGFRQVDEWPVGTCVQTADEGTMVRVGCAEPHTHRVSAVVAGDGDACPRNTVIYSSPADPDDGLTTTCFERHAATR